jgi:protein TonB
MKTNVRLLFCLLIAVVFTTTAVSAQQKIPVKEGAYNSVDKQPEFEGGFVNLFKFINENLKYPEVAVKNKIEGTVFIRFVVMKDGSIGEVEVLKGIPELNDEAVRVVKQMPKWKAGTNKGEPVDVFFTMPIKFKLS